jgi:hypothetical protein
MDVARLQRLGNSPTAARTFYCFDFWSGWDFLAALGMFKKKAAARAAFSAISRFYHHDTFMLSSQVL